ncbi:hypothetical protein [Glycomyces endophyticus]|uniref:J domain-containing protein n=1 Tax=Glycomyces endophyticus TaxID=480996 RepID=UPI0031D159CB
MDDLYAVVGIDPTADVGDIETKIKEQARLWNKRINSPDINKRHEAENMIRLLDQARTTLLDPRKRAEYDRDLAAHRASGQAAQASPGAGIDWLDRAEAALAANDYLAAAYAAKQAREHQGESAGVWAALYRSNVGLGNFQDALYEARQTLDYTPDDAGLYMDLGFIHENLGDQAGALSAYGKVAQSPGHHAQGQMASAIVLAKMSRYNEAVPILEQLYTSAPRELDRALTGDYLAEVLIESAEKVPAHRSGDQYMVTTPYELSVMQRASARALQVASNPQVVHAAHRLDGYLRSMHTRRFWPGFPVRGVVIPAVAFIAIAMCASATESGAVLVPITAVVCGLITWYQIASAQKPQWEINAIVTRMNRNGN